MKFLSSELLEQRLHKLEDDKQKITLQAAMFEGAILLAKELLAAIKDQEEIEMTPEQLQEAVDKAN